MKIKPNSYYKEYYIGNCHFLYVDSKNVYDIAFKYKNDSVIKHNEKICRGSIKSWQNQITAANKRCYISYKKDSTHDNKRLVILEEMSKEDLFLELL